MWNGQQSDHQFKQANVVDMNMMTRIPKQMALKKNKNDFYRFLLQANYDAHDNYKVNNDVFIPRSILKKNNAPGLIKEKRLELAAEEFFEYQIAMQQMQPGEIDEQFIGKYEVVFGQHINNTNPLLSPKFKQLIDEFSQMQRVDDMTGMASPRDISHDQSGQQPVVDSTGPEEPALNNTDFVLKVPIDHHHDGLLDS